MRLNSSLVDSAWRRDAGSQQVLGSALRPEAPAQWSCTAFMGFLPWVGRAAPAQVFLLLWVQEQRTAKGGGGGLKFSNKQPPREGFSQARDKASG